MIKKSLTAKENLIAVFKHKDHEWIPCTPHIANLNNLPGQLPYELLRNPLDRLKISRYVGGDVLYEIFPTKNCYSEDILVKTEKEGNFIINTLHTSVGNITNRTKVVCVDTPKYEGTTHNFSYPPPMETRTKVEHSVKRLEDYNILRYIYENSFFEIDEKKIDDAIDEVGDDGVVVVGGPSTPFYNLVSDAAGLEKTIYDLFDNPEEVEQTMHIMTEKNCEWYRRIVKTKAEVIRCTEDLDTNLVSPEMFAKYSVPVLKRYAEICHQYGKIFIVHMCGHIRDFLPVLKGAGIDGIHCLCPPKTGNTPLNYAKKILGKEVVIMARIDPLVLMNGSPEVVSGEVINMLHEMSPGDEFTLIMPCGRAPLANLQSVISTMKKHGKI